MATAWPSDLPLGAVVGSLREQISDTGVRKFKPEIGDDLTRDASTAAITKLSFDTIMTAKEWESLKTFYLANRAKVISRRHPDSGIIGAKRFRFESAPERRDLSQTHHRVSLSLVYLPTN